MSRLRCLCGAGMSNSMVPSDFIAEIYTREFFEKAIADKMELIDLHDFQKQYWYCQVCRKVTVIDNNSGKYLRSYSKMTLNDAIPFETVKDWQELLFWRDGEFYDAIEENLPTVGDFALRYPSRYQVRISPDMSKVHVFSPVAKEYLFSYLLDPKPDFSK